VARQSPIALISHYRQFTDEDEFSPKGKSEKPAAAFFWYQNGKIPIIARETTLSFLIRHAD